MVKARCYHLFRMQALLLIGMLGWVVSAHATRVFGKIFNDKGYVLPFASIQVKGTTIGTTANAQGEYFLELSPGHHVITARHVGYGMEERSIELGSDPLEINIVLREQQLSLDTVKIKAGAEDPAYAIIREAIKKRPEYHKIRTRYGCDVYTKGQIKLQSFPKTIMGQRIDFGDGDTSGNKMVYLSETQARYTAEPPNRQKTEVISTRVSGQSNGFGFSAPQVIDFYDNNVNLTRGLNPRGFVSPIADGALQFYKYKYMGAFFENGRQVNRIQVIPRRSYEPLFSGYINITENDWRIHSLQLELTKASQLEFLDKLKLEMIYIPVRSDLWMVQSQTLYPVVSFMGFSGNGYFTSIFSNYEIEPELKKGFFDRVILHYDENANKRDSAWWSLNRPIPLSPEEITDYRKKDSLERLRQDPRVLDSLDHIQNKLTPVGLLFNGQFLQRRSKGTTFVYDPLFKAISFNTVEGWSAQLSGTWEKELANKSRLILVPIIRYGIHNGHFNPYMIAKYRFGKFRDRELMVSGGSRIFQFNNDNPIPQVLNTFTTLYDGHNWMKIYEARTVSAEYTHHLDAGITIRGGLSWQHRLPLENTDSTSYWGRNSNRERLTQNWPVEISSQNIPVHDALTFSAEIRWKPGAHYIEFPDRRFAVSTGYPNLTLQYVRGLPWLGSAVSYDRWRFEIQQNINLRLAGEFRYAAEMGGFLSKKNVQLPDFIHFTGNLTRKAGPYLNTFQLLSYYDRSGLYDFYTAAHVEHHFNGFLTNKIPLVKKLNLHLIAGANMLWTGRNDPYSELFVGLDNVLKILRFDYAWSWDKQGAQRQGIRIGIYAFGNLFTDQ
jgi:hypothetical protein